MERHLANKPASCLFGNILGNGYGNVNHPGYMLVHPLPPAPNFVGREAELEELRGLWRSSFRGVLALVGLGGAGKTAVAARFLEEVMGAEAPDLPGRLFLWSFYQEPDAALFLQAAYQYFASPTSVAPAAKGAGLLHLLREALAEGGPHWLVLDGLEKIQQQENTGKYGQIEDPLLKGLLTRIAEGMGQTVALVTSRFPLTDLHAYEVKGYRHLDIGGLSRPAALALLRQLGVKGEEADLDGLIENYGAHALTLDHLGGLIGQFLEGNPYRAPEVAELVDPGKDRQALRLARLLRAYEEHLPPTELALLCRLCLLRRSVTEEQVQQFFLCSPPVSARMVREIGNLILRFPGLKKHLDDDRVHHLVEAIRTTLEEALCTKPIAGREELFRAEISTLAEKVLEVHEKATEEEFGELARLYSDTTLDQPSTLRPLDAKDREALRSWYAHFAALSEHPLMPFRKAAPALEQAFQKMGLVEKRRPAELIPADVVEGLKRAKRALCYLMSKHFALQRVRELCRTYQGKWVLAGPLANLCASDLHQVLEALVGRHLLHREGNGFFSVHPAVRDHFHRLATTLDQGAWHDILREQMVNLAKKPGQRHPEDPATLDLVEEAVYHSLAAGRADEALGLYHHVLGGLRHLGWKLGEMARGLRILRGFNTCPEPWDLGWYLRALGELDQAFACNEVPYFQADILLLQGRLPEVAVVGDSTRTPIAEFLMGLTTSLPPDQLGAAIPREHLLLYLGRLDQVRRASLLGSFYHDIGRKGDHARCQILAAEAARRQADPARCHSCLEAASAWILHSGSVEHLCLLHLVRARLARAEGQTNNAQSAVTEGLHVARQCGLGLYLVELLCEQAEILLIKEDAPAAEQTAREAWHRALSASCQFMWGAAQAGHLVGQALCNQKRFEEAGAVLKKTLLLRQRIGDPAAVATEHLLSTLPRLSS
jgi:hypothetical protein